MKINWKHKFTSRKFLGCSDRSNRCFVSSFFNVDDLTSEKVVTLVATIGLLVAYIVGEGFVDSNRGN